MTMEAMKDQGSFFFIWESEDTTSLKQEDSMGLL